MRPCRCKWADKVLKELTLVGLSGMAGEENKEITVDVVSMATKDQEVKTR